MDASFSDSNPLEIHPPQPHPCDTCGKKALYYQVHGKNPEDDDPNLLRCEECNDVLRYLVSSFGMYT
jgi:hypothetical protein